jgi:hypothetical protein
VYNMSSYYLLFSPPIYIMYIPVTVANLACIVCSTHNLTPPLTTHLINLIPLMKYCYLGFEANLSNASLEVTITNNWARRRHAVLFLYKVGFLQLQCDYGKESEDSIRRDTQLQCGHPAMYAVCVNNDLCREIITFL